MPALGFPYDFRLVSTTSFHSLRLNYPSYHRTVTVVRINLEFISREAQFPGLLEAIAYYGNLYWIYYRVDSNRKI